MSDIDLTQLDLTDPETRKYAESQVDLSDPETKQWWDSTAPKEAPAGPKTLGQNFGTGVRDLVEGTGGLLDLVGGPANAGVNWATGSNLSTSPGHDIGKYIADQLGLSVADGDMEELASAINQGGIQGLLSAGAGQAMTGAKGITGVIGKALAESPLLDTLSGALSGASGELAEQAGAGQLGQLGAAAIGGLTPFGMAAAGRRLYRAVTADGIVPESEFVRDLFIERGSDTTPGFDPRTPPQIDNVEIANRLQAAYDAGQTADQLRAIAGDIPLDKLDEMIAYREQHGKGGRFVPETPEEVALAQEAAAFKPKAEPTVEDLFPTEEGQAAKAKALEEKLAAEAETFKAGKAQEEAPVVADKEPTLEAATVKEHVDELTATWTNGPKVDVRERFDGTDDLDPHSLGVYDPETGTVSLNAEAIAKEAEHRGLTQKEMTNTVMFHEGLGHYGLAQKFRDELDYNLNQFYENSAYFRKQVDKWIRKNPDAYADEDTVARAGEEVLAEMSEQGRIALTYMNKIKNLVKQYAREIGLQLKFSEREIRTLLAQAHEAVISGKGADVRGNGYRSMKGERIRPEPEAAKTFLKELGLFVNKELSDMPPEEAINRASRVGIDRAWLDYFENRRRIAWGSNEPKLEQPDMKKYLPDVDLKRPMKSTYGSGSDGPLQGAAAKDEKLEPSTVNKFRSNRNIEEIMDEAAPTKTKESWEEWIDGAEKTKMTGKIAASLAKGTEVPELLAAQEYAVKSANRIYDLSRKAASGKASERDLALLGKEMERLEEVSDAITNVVANAARLLNSRNITIESNKALTDGIRNMIMTADTSTPEGVKAAAEKIVKDQKKARRIAKTVNVLGNVLNLPRTIMSSFDLSAPLRQGIFLVGRKELWKNIPSMFKQFSSEEAFQSALMEIQSRPTHTLMERSGLALSELGSDLTQREEQFISQWAEKIPVLGKGIRASERGYTGFLNKVRADTFDSLVKLSADAKIDLKKNPKALKDIASFVNNATGRGDLGALAKAGPILNGIFFSPRLIAARVNMLNPAYYVRLSPVVRKEALKSLLSLGTIAASVAMLAKMGGADVETDPRSSDFAKIKTGDTRYDILGGFGQYLTLGARMATNQKKDMKGEIVELGKKFGSDTRLDVVGKFFTNKESPVASFVTDFLRGKNAIGEPFEVDKAVASRFIPLFLQDAAEMIEKQGAVKGSLMATPGIFGIGTQTYPAPQGSDVYGRSYESDRSEDTPAIAEIKRLEEVMEESVLGPPGKSLTINGERRKLTEDEFADYQTLSGGWITQAVDEEMKTEEWGKMSDQEKAQLIYDIKRDARAAARDYLFAGDDDQPEGGDDDTTD